MIAPEDVHGQYEVLLNALYFISAKEESLLPIFKRARHAVKEEVPKRRFTQADIGTASPPLPFWRSSFC